MESASRYAFIRKSPVQVVLEVFKRLRVSLLETLCLRIQAERTAQPVQVLKLR